jgi:hypothetical protein
VSQDPPPKGGLKDRLKQLADRLEKPKRDFASDVQKMSGSNKPLNGMGDPAGMVAAGSTAEAEGAKDVASAVFHVIDRHTGTVIKVAKNIKRARAMVDKLDNEYGGYKHAIKEVSADGTKSGRL